MSSHSPISFAEATRTWVRVALLSFGGPAGQIAVMHRILVDEKRWISEPRFLHALSYCMLLPGPEAQQLATYIGWLFHGTRGGLVAGGLFILPGLIAIMALSFLYVAWRGHPLMDGLLLGLKAAVVALVFEALLRIGSRALRDLRNRIVAFVAFVGIAVLHWPFPVIVIGAGIAGWMMTRHGVATAAAARRDADSDVERPADARASRPPAPALRGSLRMLALWLPLWLAPVLVAGMLAGHDHVFTQLGVFFSQMAVVSFGGAYAVLAYVAQQAVNQFGWITTGQMMDGLGLAESTPGPLIMVVQFVGFLAAWQTAGADHPLVAGIIGALVTVWVTFVPSFLWIFLGAPYVERLRGSVALAGAMSAITAAVVGVIASLALWFSVHVLFEQVNAQGLPEFTSLRPVPAALTAVALLALFQLRLGLGRTLLVCTALGTVAAIAGWM
ncbi:MAG TPA: chromate efflux transporter [Steroidobacteraceae bacterium]